MMRVTKVELGMIGRDSILKDTEYQPLQEIPFVLKHLLAIEPGATSSFLRNAIQYGIIVDVDIRHVLNRKGRNSPLEPEWLVLQ